MIEIIEGNCTPLACGVATPVYGIFVGGTCVGFGIEHPGLAAYTFTATT